MNRPLSPILNLPVSDCCMGWENRSQRVSVLYPSPTSRYGQEYIIIYAYKVVRLHLQYWQIELVNKKSQVYGLSTIINSISYLNFLRVKNKDHVSCLFHVGYISPICYKQSYSSFQREDVFHNTKTLKTSHIISCLSADMKLEKKSLSLFIINVALMNKSKNKCCSKIRCYWSTKNNCQNWI